MKRSSSSNNSKNDLIRYAGLGTQLLVSIGIAVFIGLKADQWLHTSPLFSCTLPLLVLFAILYKIMRQTGNRNEDSK
jgi:F0F1-type ATP synthase assembly protein I